MSRKKEVSGVCKRYRSDENAYRILHGKLEG
jgi:hypothetical protein